MEISDGKNIEIPRRNSNNILHANLYTCNSKKIILVCHGFPGDKIEHGRFPMVANALNKEGFDAIAFDLPGFGDNMREPVSFNILIEAVEDVFKWAKDNNYERFGTIGLSIGGLITLLADLPEREVAVFWAPAFYLRKIMAGKFGKGFLNAFTKIFKKDTIKMSSSGENEEKILVNIDFVNDVFKFDIVEKLNEFNTPSLIIQGTFDLLVRKNVTKKAFTFFPQDKDHRLILVKGATHNFKKDKIPKFIEPTVDWFKFYMN